MTHLASFARRELLIALMGLLVTLSTAGTLARLRINLTASLPPGLYLASPLRRPVRGELVLACLPAPVATSAKARAYVPQGGTCPERLVPIGKEVFAIEGDTVVVSAGGLAVNGVVVPNSAALGRDRAGRPLPRIVPGRYIVGASELWVGSTYSRWSFDSRYFGALKTRDIRSCLRPLWTHDGRGRGLDER